MSTVFGFDQSLKLESDKTTRSGAGSGPEKENFPPSIRALSLLTCIVCELTKPMKITPSSKPITSPSISYMSEGTEVQPTAPKEPTAKRSANKKNLLKNFIS
ncbi:hypothetical protein SDC9_208084 [bioreactor metagenome]|uniref:Uncharacterized protein n=1 Tax=bioreactor metagenome TaxID=1076179 RepID=A0A645JAA3_9ZZZZ